MAAPAKPDGVEDGGGGGRTVVEFDDIEKQLGEGDPAKPNPTPQELFNQRLEGENVPETLRGKSLNEVLRQFEGMGQALRVSEKAREDLAKFAERPSAAPAPVAAPVREEPKPLSEDEINEMFKENPAKAIQTLWNQANGQITRHIDQRLAPLSSGMVADAEAKAREKYTLEFSLFGDEIAAMYNQIPDKSVFSTAAGWRDMIEYIRGREGNLDRYVEAKANGGKPKTLETARETERGSAGFHPTATQRAPAPTGGGSQDPIKKEIADNLGMSYEEYVKWEKLGR